MPKTNEAEKFLRSLCDNISSIVKTEFLYRRRIELNFAVREHYINKNLNIEVLLNDGKDFTTLFQLAVNEAEKTLNIFINNDFTGDGQILEVTKYVIASYGGLIQEGYEHYRDMNEYNDNDEEGCMGCQRCQCCDNSQEEEDQEFRQEDVGRAMFYNEIFQRVGLLTEGIWN